MCRKGLVRPGGAVRRPAGSRPAGERDHAVVQAAVRESAQGWIGRRPVFLDVETTGLTGIDQVLQVGIVDYLGEVLVDTLIKPTCEIAEGAAAVHGITMPLVADAPWFADVWAVVSTILRNRVVIAYNADFELRMIKQSLRWAGIQSETIGGITKSTYCAMRMYARYWGDWNPRRWSYRWQKLADAIVQQEIELDGNMHAAVVDAEATRRLVYAMAGLGVPDA